jgi:Holliday junction resolvase-like predicted endonuclease
MIEKLRMWSIESKLGAESAVVERVADQRPLRSTERLTKADERRRVVLVERKNASARDEKKARRRVDAPSNKTLWQLLLGFHSSHSLPAGTRTNTRFFVVAGYQQGNSSTAYPQSGVDGLGTASARLTPCQNKLKLSVERNHYRFEDLQCSHLRSTSECALTPNDRLPTPMTFHAVKRPNIALNEQASAG